MRLAVFQFCLFFSIIFCFGNAKLGKANLARGHSKVHADATSITQTKAETNCDCFEASIWLDIVFMVDVSKDMTEYYVQEANALLISSMYQWEWGSGRYQSRVGVVSYSINATQLYDFGILEDTDSVDDLYLPYVGDVGTNIQSAFLLASQMLNKPVPGRNARKVIAIVGGSAYRQVGEIDPAVFAAQFKNAGGIILTTQRSCGVPPVPKLQELASPGYAFTGDDFMPPDLSNAFCQANCFCGSDFSPFSTNTQLAPDGGCYEYVAAPGVLRAANDDCTRKRGTLVQPHNSRKEQFLATLLPPKRPYWIGLTKSGDSYSWLDGTNYTSAYQNWANGEPSTAGGDCVTVQQYDGFNSGWFATECAAVRSYICQYKPCSSGDDQCVR